MEKPKPSDRKNLPESFSVDCLKQTLPYLRADLSQIGTSYEVQSFIASLTDNDFIDIYAEWLFRKKNKDTIMQTGFIFEILSRRFVKSVEKTSEMGELVRQSIMFLNLSQNNQRMWNAERSTPDDVGILETEDTIFVNKVYESKITLKAMNRSTAQRAESMITINFLINALNGSDNKIKSKAGWKVLVQAMENLFDRCDLPVEMAPNCEYCYILPSDQKFVQSPYEPVQFQTMNIPLTISHIEQIRALTIGSFSKNFGI